MGYRGHVDFVDDNLIGGPSTACPRRSRVLREGR